MRNSMNGYQKYEQYNKRNEGNIIDLFNFDKVNNTWKPFVEYYSSKFNVEPVIPFDDDSGEKTPKSV